MKTVFDFKKAKKIKTPISMVTCYDFTSAQIIESSSIDCILVGDSVAMTQHGYPNTTFATMDMMKFHTQMVANGIKNRFIISDMPFLSFRTDLTNGVQHVCSLIQAGAHSVKIEGAQIETLHFIRHIVESGIPVMGHIGLTPQSVHQLGGFRLQGKTHKEEERLYREAQELEKNGCFAIVLECIPSALGERITNALSIPTIGIGAGPFVDGQVLVWQDLLGLNPDFKPQFVRHFMNGKNMILNSLNDFDSAVKNKSFPSLEEESYSI